MIVIENAYAEGISMCEARRFTSEEKLRYSFNFRERGLVGIPDTVIALPHIHWKDLPQRSPDGEFLGCSNEAWIISDVEAAQYQMIEAERAKAEHEKREAKEKAKREQEEQRAAEMAKIRSKFDRWETVQADKHSERHTMTINGETFQFTVRKIPDVGVVVNPEYSVSKGLKPGGICINNPPEGRIWMTTNPDGSWRKVRKLTKAEAKCIEAIIATSNFIRRWQDIWDEDNSEW